MSVLPQPEAITVSNSDCEQEGSVEPINLLEYRHIEPTSEDPIAVTELASPVSIHLADLKVAEEARANNTAFEALVSQYTGLILKEMRGYFLTGATRQDLFQEGLLGLYEGVRDYKGQMPLASFLKLCIKRQIIDAVKTSTRQKQRILNEYVSLSLQVGEKEEDTLINVLPGGSRTPEDIVIGDESYLDLLDLLMSGLSRLEAEVLRMYIDNVSYAEISEKLGKDNKSVDNALQRVKKKIEARLAEAA